MSLQIILGPMFSGKTTQLINCIKISNTPSERKLIINHKLNTRYNNNSNNPKIISHNGLSIPCISIDNLEEIFTNYHNYNLYDLNNIDEIYIDEAQFFNSLYDIIHKLLFEYKKNIYIAGLDGNFQQKPFYNSQLLYLIPLANSVIKLNSICSICQLNAPFTIKRPYNSVVDNVEGDILVGGSEIYQPVCINHLNNL